MVLVIGALSWIAISLIFNPAPQGPAGAHSVELSSAPKAPESKNPVPETSGQDPSSSAQFPNEADPQDERTGELKKLIIHVIGAVKSPGVYELPAGSRARDAVASAGGLSSNAAPENINLAANLADGQQVRIPKRGEKPASVTEPLVVPGALPSAPDASEESDGSTTPSGTAGSKINVNTAQGAQLQELPGIGPALAQRIMDFRQSNGPFTSLTELDAVSGIGPVLLNKIRDRVAFK